MTYSIQWRRHSPKGAPREINRETVADANALIYFISEHIAEISWMYWQDDDMQFTGKG